MRLRASYPVYPLLALLLLAGLGAAQHGAYNPMLYRGSPPVLLSGPLITCPTCAETDQAETITQSWTWDSANYFSFISTSGFLQLKNKATNDYAIYEVPGMSRYYNSTGKTIALGFPTSAPAANATYYLPSALPIGTYLLNMAPSGIIGYDDKNYLTVETDPIATHNDTTEVITGQWDFQSNPPLAGQPTTFTDTSLICTASSSDILAACGDVRIQQGTLNFEEADGDVLVLQTALSGARVVTLPNATGTLLVAEADTLSTVAARGGFAGTETIAPAYAKQAKHYNPDDVPSSPNAADDEFDDGSLAVKWSWHSGVAPTNVNEGTTFAGYLYADNANVAKTDLLQQSVAIAGQFIIRGKCGALNEEAHCGIFAVDTNGTGYGMSIYNVGTSGCRYALLTITTWTPVESLYNGNECMEYLEVRRFSDNYTVASFSPDGFLFSRNSGTTWASDVAYIGVYYQTAAPGIGAYYPPTVTLDWFRRLTP